MNLYDKGYVWKMETPPANSNHLLEEEEENEDDKEEKEEEKRRRIPEMKIFSAFKGMNSLGVVVHNFNPNL